MRLQDTIVAVSTPPGRGGLGVIRISGTEALRITAEMLEAPALTPRTATLATLTDDHGNAIDQVVVTYFQAPRSYTAEDVVEISCHGAPVILRHGVERACSAGARIAEPGEFTLRAYVNGRLDLPQAEAVRDLIDATTLYQARVAAQQVEGSVSRRIAPIKRQLLDLIALLEAGIDFAEDDIDVAPDAEIARRLDPLITETETLACSFAYGKLVHDGFSLAIVGRPNVGKSSLFNRLLQQDRAIVTDIAGTTRDTVSETASLDGIPVRFLDTAGIREGAELVETLGIQRSYQAMADADLTLLVIDASSPLTPDDRSLLSRAASQGRHIVVLNKSDLPTATEIDGTRVSALTSSGIPELRAQILRTLSPDGLIEQDAGFLTSIRHEQLLREASTALRHAREALGHALPHEMLLLDFYAALTPIDAITGATTADDILNRIFSTFCIGK